MSFNEKDTLTSTAGFETVQECLEERELVVEGKIPEWLHGVLYRTGPGQFEVQGKDGKPSFNVQHWFDGKALNHKFTIKGGEEQKVFYRSKFAVSDQVAKESKLGHMSRVTFAQPYDPCERLYTKFNMAFRSLMGINHSSSPSDTNVNVTMQFDHQKRTLTTKTDTITLQKLNPTTLEPIEAFQYEDINKSLGGHLAAAHSASIDGLSYNFVLKFGPKPFYKVFSIDENTGKSKILCKIVDAPAAYLHSLAVTESYVVLSIWQADIGLMGLGIPWKNNVLDNIKKWSKSRKTIHYIINRKTGEKVNKIISDSFFCFHHINAFESLDGKEICLDLATFKDTSILESLRLDQVRNFDGLTNPTPEYRRIVLPVHSNGKTTEIQSRPARTDINIELPTIHPEKQWKKARFTYGVHHTFKEKHRHMFVDSIIKIDLDHESLNDLNTTQKTNPSAYKVWQGDGMVPGEPIFVPHPEGKEEDDGIILTIALDVYTQKSKLIILDAKSMNVIASANMNTIFPFGFHGTFADGFKA